MSNTEHLEPTERLVSPPEGEETQRMLEFSGEWDDNKRREAVKRNQQESDGEPLSYEDSLDYFQNYEKDFTDAGLESAKDNEERETWQTLAEKMRLDVELAKVGSGPPLGRLIREVESHLESLNRMKEEGENDTSVHEKDIEDLRRVRDSLFTKYEQIPPSAMRESAESILVGLTGQAVPEHLRNGVKHKENTAEEESTQERPKLGDVLLWTDQALGWNMATSQFQKLFGEIDSLSARLTSGLTEELFELYNQHVAGDVSGEEYLQAIDGIFKRYEKEHDAPQAA